MIIKLINYNLTLPYGFSSQKTSKGQTIFKMGIYSTFLLQPHNQYFPERDKILFISIEKQAYLLLAKGLTQSKECLSNLSYRGRLKVITQLDLDKGILLTSSVYSYPNCMSNSEQVVQTQIIPYLDESTSSSTYRAAIVLQHAGTLAKH